jgi:hypothetical protein
MSLFDDLVTVRHTYPVCDLQDTHNPFQTHPQHKRLCTPQYQLPGVGEAG